MRFVTDPPVIPPNESARGKPLWCLRLGFLGQDSFRGSPARHKSPAAHGGLSPQRHGCPRGLPLPEIPTRRERERGQRETMVRTLMRRDLGRTLSAGRPNQGLAHLGLVSSKPWGALLPPFPFLNAPRLPCSPRNRCGVGEPPDPGPRVGNKFSKHWPLCLPAGGPPPNESAGMAFALHHPTIGKPSP
jgi:hypothetical protein